MRDEEQAVLLKKVVNITEVRPKDQKTGQQKLFGTVEEFAPGFQEWASMMNQKLSQSGQQNEALLVKLNESTAQAKRLANSLESVIPKLLDQSVNHEASDIVFGYLPEGQEADVAVADGANVPGESLYILSAGEIADKVGNKSMSATRMGRLLRELKLFGDPRFHHTFKTSRKGVCQKYKPSIADEVYKRLQFPDRYGIDPSVVAKSVNYIKPRGVSP